MPDDRTTYPTAWRGRRSRPTARLLAPHFWPVVGGLLAFCGVLAFLVGGR